MEAPDRTPPPQQPNKRERSGSSKKRGERESKQKKTEKAAGEVKRSFSDGELADRRSRSYTLGRKFTVFMGKLPGISKVYRQANEQTFGSKEQLSGKDSENLANEIKIKNIFIKKERAKQVKFEEELEALLENMPPELSEKLPYDLKESAAENFKNLFNLINNKNDLSDDETTYLLDCIEKLQGIRGCDKEIEELKSAQKKYVGDEANSHEVKVAASHRTSKNLRRLAEKLGGKEVNFEIEKEKEEDMEIQGMIFGASGEKFDPKKKTILLFTGSGEPAENYAFPMVRRLQEMGSQVMIVNPPGFGKSKGEPTTENCLITADASYLYLRDLGVNEGDIAVMGYSLGGPLAAHVAAKYEGTPFIGDRTFTAIHNVAAESVGEMTSKRLGKLTETLSKPLLKGMIGDLKVDLKAIKGKKFVASGEDEESNYVLAKSEKDLTKSTRTVIFKGGHDHHDENLWFAQDSDAAREFEEFINSFLSDEQ